MSYGEADFRRMVQGLITDFTSRASALFETTRPLEFRNYYKGVYALQFAKPTRSVRRLLSIEREILILATSYTDVHARVNQLAVETIDGSDGRLERTVAIIIHEDPLGNNKLRNWGRDLGLTVIPLYVPSRGMPAGDALERLLLSEFFSHDPFDVTGPVSDDNQFYGRRDEAHDLARQLQAGQVRSCLGIRKSGKTSVLHRVLAVAQDYHDCYVVVIDCSKDVVWQMDAARLLQAIADAIPNSISSNDFCANVAGVDGEATIASAYINLIAALREAPGTVVLMFDEVDYITPGSPTTTHWVAQFNAFWRNLRAAYQELARSPVKLSVLVGGVSSKWFSEETIAGVENAALAFIPDEYLLPLPRGASIAMVQSIGRTSGLILDDDAAGTIADMCSNMPFWMRKAGSYVHRHTDVPSRPRPVDAQTIRGLLDAFLESEGASIADVALSHLFRVYPELRAVAQASLKGDAHSQPAALRVVLRKYGVTDSSGPEAKPTGAMMVAGLKMALERDHGVAGSGAISAPTSPLAFSSLDEWAEELAVVGAQRNKLERRLRGVAVNFIRFDALQNKQKGSAADRLLRVIDEGRRSRLEKLPADEAVEKFNWSDLARVIEREWPLFASVFVDKVQFAQHWTVVNERFDAHAKLADRADLANYRRSLAWLENALARCG